MPKKALVLNKTNYTEIKDVYGSKDEAWHGKKINLYTTTVNMNGKLTLVHSHSCADVAGARDRCRND